MKVAFIGHNLLTSPEFEQESQTWDYNRRLGFIRLLYSMIGFTVSYWNASNEKEKLPCFKFPLRLADYKALLSKLLAENPEMVFSMQDIHWLKTCMLFPEEEANREEFVYTFLPRFLKNRQQQFTVKVEVTPELMQDKTLQSVFIHPPKQRIEVIINHNDPRLDLDQVVDFLNKLKILNSGFIAIENANIRHYGIERIVSLLRRVNNPSFEIRIRNAELREHSHEIFLKLIQALRSPIRFSSFDLADNELDEWTEAQFVQFITTLAEQTSFDNINLSYNGLWKKDIQFLEALKNKIAQYSHWQNFTLWDGTDSTTELPEDFYKQWTAQTQLAVLKLTLEIPSQTNLFDFPSLIKGEHCKVSAEDFYVLLSHWKGFSQWGSTRYILSRFIEECDLLPEHRLDLFLRTLEDMNDFKENFNFDLIEHLIEDQGGEAFTEDSMEEQDESASPIKKLLVVVYGAHECIDAIESGEASEDTLQEEVIPAIRLTCQALWPDSNFYEATLNKLETFPLRNEYDSQKLANMVSWFLWTTLLIWHKGAALQEFEDTPKILHAIAEHPAPKGRYALSKGYLNHVLASPQGLKLYQDLIAKQADFKLLPAIFLAKMIINNQQPEFARPLFERATQLIKAHLQRDYKEGSNLFPFMGALESLAETASISAMDKLALTEMVLKAHGVEGDRKKRFKTQRQNWLLIQGLSQLNEITLLRDTALGQEKVSFQKVAMQIVQKLFNLDKTQMEAYEATFSPLRNQTGVLTYLGAIRALKGADNQGAKLEALYQQFIRSVLSPNQQQFYLSRYNELNSPHLEKVFANRKLLKELWMQERKYDFSAFIEHHNIQERARSIDFSKFINRVLKNNHLDSQAVPNLVRYLESNSIEVKDKVKAELEEMLGEDEGNYLNNDMLSVERLLIALLETPLDQKGKCLQFLKEIQRELRGQGKFPEFKNDLAMLIVYVKDLISVKKLRSIQGWTIVFGDYFWDLFMSGTDVMGSCQRVDGDPTLNKCLLAYCIDGKNKILAIKDSSGRMVARSIVRLLLVNGKVVLYRENMYPETLTSIQRQALEIFSMQLANIMNIPLYSSEPQDNSYTSPDPASSLGSSSIAEYVDGLHSTTNGEFSIPNAHVIPARLEERRVAETREALEDLLPILDKPQAIKTLQTQALISLIAEYESDEPLTDEEHESQLALTWMQDRVKPCFQSPEKRGSRNADDFEAEKLSRLIVDYRS